MKIKERGRYIAISPDNDPDDKTLKDENSAQEYTDGFYSSESDNFVPDDTGGG